MRNEIIKKLKGKKVVIYGASSLAKHYKRELNEMGVQVACFVVTNNYKKDDFFDDTIVYELEKLPFSNDECYIIICTSDTYEVQVREELHNFGYSQPFITLGEIEMAYFEPVFKKYNIEFNGAFVNFGEISIKNLFNIEKNFDYITHMMFLAIGDCLLPPGCGDISMIDEGPYENGKVKIGRNDVVVDCGANIGAFTCAAAAKAASVYAFEPQKICEKVILEACSKYREKIFYSDFALAACKKEMSLDGVGVSASISDITSESKAVIKTISLDEFVIENNIKKIDFIKADVEGAERLLLEGAKNVLNKMAPKLAICTYHLPDDPQILEDLIIGANSKYIVEHRWKKLFAYVSTE